MRKKVLDEQAANVRTKLNEFEADQIKVETQMKLVEEKVDRAEDELKMAERSLRRR
jgi:hypothetical protein